MAFSRVAKSTLQETATTSATPTLANVTSGNLIILACSAYSNGSSMQLPATITDNQGNTLTRRTAAFNDGDPGGFPLTVAVYSLVLPASYASYSATVTISNAGATSGTSAVLMEYSGETMTFEQTAQNSVNGTSVTSAASGTTAANSATTELAVAALTVYAGGANPTGFVQNGGANWPTANTTPDTDGATLAVEDDGSGSFNVWTLSDSMTTAWHSATASDAWTTTASMVHYAAAIATFATAAAGPPPPQTTAVWHRRPPYYAAKRVY